VKARSTEVVEDKEGFICFSFIVKRPKVIRETVISFVPVSLGSGEAYNCLIKIIPFL